MKITPIRCRRRPPFLLGLLILAGAILAACAAPQTKAPTVQSAAAEEEARKQRELVVEAFVDKRTRLFRVGHRIFTRGSMLCGEQSTHAVGVQVMSLDFFGEAWREAASSKLGLTEKLRLIDVVPDSPADAVGLRAGDVLLAIDDWTVPAGEEALEQTNKRVSGLLQSGDPIRFNVRRGTEELAFTAVPVPACDYNLVLIAEDVKNAFADGNSIVFFTGLMDFFQSEEELALVLSHELAHNSMDHVASKKTNAMMGGIFGLILDVAAAAGGVNTGGGFTDIGMQAGAGAYSVAFEKEADYVGLYFMALAGYDLSEAPNLWRRMATMSPQSIQLRGSHPTTPERFVALEQAIREIERKKQQGLSLSPEMKLK